MKRRRDWFLPVQEANTALWWVPAGYQPTAVEAEQRVRLLRDQGPTPRSFTLRRSWALPDLAGTEVTGQDDWLCPA